MFSKNCLDTHNALRAKHGSPALQWNFYLERHAEKWARVIARSKSLVHDAAGLNAFEEGENLALFVPEKPKCSGKQNKDCYSCEEIVNAWYSEIKNYDFQKADTNNGQPYKTFTQVNRCFKLGKLDATKYFKIYFSNFLGIFHSSCNFTLNINHFMLCPGEHFHSIFIRYYFLVFDLCCINLFFPSGIKIFSDFQN